MREELSAIDHLKIWKRYQLYWCEHKPSITVSIKDHEWMEVGQFNEDSFGGLAWLFRCMNKAMGLLNPNSFHGGEPVTI